MYGSKKLSQIDRALLACRPTKQGLGLRETEGWQADRPDRGAGQTSSQKNSQTARGLRRGDSGSGGRLGLERAQAGRTGVAGRRQADVAHQLLRPQGQSEGDGLPACRRRPAAADPVDG